MGIKDKVSGFAEKSQERVKKAQEVNNEKLAAQQASRDAAGVIFAGISHDPGRNAKVTLYADRIERVKEKALGSLSKAHQDAELTPMRAVSSVQAKKEGFRTKVTVYASGNNIDFRFAHDEAHAFKAAIQELLLSPAHSAVPPAPAPEAQAPAAADPVEQIERFGALRDKGLLSEEEFQAKKREILGL